MKAYQRTLEGGIKVATGNRIKDQLAAIMECYPETQGDEDLLGAMWLREHTLDGVKAKVSVRRLARLISAYRKADIRRRRQEMAADGSFPWPTDEAERRQKRAKGGVPR